jgi:cytochrome P450
MCIGNNFAMMEMVLVLAVFLKQYKPVYAGKGKPVCEPLITLRPKGGIPLYMEKL